MFVSRSPVTVTWWCATQHTLRADKGLAAAISRVWPNAVHLPCCFHLLQNAKKKGNVDPVQFWLLQTSATETEFQSRLKVFASKHSDDVVTYLRNIEQPWILYEHVELGIRTYGFRTSNLSEILNATLLQTRELPPLPLMMATCRHAANELQRACDLASAWEDNGDVLVPYAVKLGEKTKQEALGLQGTREVGGSSATCVVDAVQAGRQRQTFSLAARRVTAAADNDDDTAGMCECMKPSMLGFWCKHAYTAEWFSVLNITLS